MTTQKPLDPQQKMDIEAILEGLEDYHPIRKGWVWRKVMEDGVDMGPFHFRNMSEPLKNSIGLPASNILTILIRNQNVLLQLKLPQADLKMTCGGCAWLPGMALTT